VRGRKEEGKKKKKKDVHKKKKKKKKKKTLVQNLKTYQCDFCHQTLKNKIEN
jgi:hypothetical protein